MLKGSASGSGNGSSGGGAFPFIGPTLAILGDSITAQNSVNIPGAGGTISNSNLGYATWWNIHNGQRIYLPPTSNFGFPLDTIALASVRVPALIAAKPSIAIVLLGVNDISNNRTFAQMKTDMLTLILQPILAAGIITCVIPVLPCNTLTTAQQQVRCQFDNWLRELGLGRSDALAAAGFPAGRNIIVSDPTPYLEDFATGLPKTAMFQDGKHPSQLGAYWMGWQLHKDVSPFIPPRPTAIVDWFDYYDATTNPSGNVYTNGTVNYGLLQGTAGTLTVNSGITPTGVVCNAAQLYAANVTSNMTLVGAKQNPRLDSPFTGERQIMTAHATLTGGVQETVVFNATTLGAISTGDIIYAECTYEIDATSAPANLMALELQATDFGNVGQNLFASQYAGSFAGAQLPAHAGTLRTPIATMLSTSPSIQLNVKAIFDATQGSLGYNGKIYIGDLNLKKLVAY